MSRKSKIFIACHQEDKKTALVLSQHLRQLDAIALDMFSIELGKDSRLEIIRLMESSEIIVGILSPNFLDCELNKLIEQYAKRGHRLIPVLYQNCALNTSYWKSLQCLPRENIAIITKRKPERDQLILEIAEEIAEAARQELRPLREILSDWSLRHRELTALGAKYHDLDPTKFLIEIERTLQALPLLRCTLNDRRIVWEQMIEYLDLNHPEQRLKARLSAMPEDHFRVLRGSPWIASST